MPLFGSNVTTEGPLRPAMNKVVRSVTRGRVAEPGMVVRAALMDAFVACRTTLEDLSKRTAAQGICVSPGAIAAHLTGHADLTEQDQHGIADAINTRLRELAKPPTAPSPPSPPPGESGIE